MELALSLWTCPSFPPAPILENENDTAVLHHLPLATLSALLFWVSWGGPLAQQVRDCPPFFEVPVVSVSPKLSGWRSSRKCYTDLCSTKLLNFSRRQELEDEGKQAHLL